MGTETKIAWTDHTMNPWMGCTRVSAGCAHCYAETLTSDRMGLKLWGPKAKRQVTKTPWLEAPRWNRAALAAGERRRVFCASLCDVFEDHPTANETRPRLWSLIADCTALDWQLLTKRPENIARMLPPGFTAKRWPHVWLGTSIEDMKVARRADELRKIDARVRFISYEPALGPLHELDLRGIHWLIQGGESGPGYRPMPVEWAREMRAACARAGTAYFFKQSAAARTEMGIELDGELVRAYPVEALPRNLTAAAS